ncbi:hypothetical protein L798_07153 [Zootermopsis nevadensis]|uniref:Uncharacterized protein n=1 Tax=Zootermopsis nevadensis TaxID=136037 RepID=A0A067RHC3_ZOONE|nr:hypothetical protein L798_07153 [Zootermopsis nevadensis]
MFLVPGLPTFWINKQATAWCQAPDKIGKRIFTLTGSGKVAVNINLRFDVLSAMWMTFFWVTMPNSAEDGDDQFISPRCHYLPRRHFKYLRYLFFMQSGKSKFHAYIKLSDKLTVELLLHYQESRPDQNSFIDLHLSLLRPSKFHDYLQHLSQFIITLPFRI